MTEDITKDMAIGEVVDRYPEVVDTLMGFGVHCVGCGVSFWETLEEGLMSHGRSSAEVENIVKKLNEVKQKEDTKPETLHSTNTRPSLTDKAAEKLKLLLAEEKDVKGLRIQVVPGGCSGFQYAFDFEQQAAPEDQTWEEKGIMLFVDKDSMEMLGNATVDYVDSLQGAGFKVSNPNAKHSCGCGKSFG